MHSKVLILITDKLYIRKGESFMKRKMNTESILLLKHTVLLQYQIEKAKGTPKSIKQCLIIILMQQKLIS